MRAKRTDEHHGEVVNGRITSVYIIAYLLTDNSCIYCSEGRCGIFRVFVLVSAVSVQMENTVGPVGVEYNETP